MGCNCGKSRPPISNVQVNTASNINNATSSVGISSINSPPPTPQQPPRQPNLNYFTGVSAPSNSMNVVGPMGPVRPPSVVNQMGPTLPTNAVPSLNRPRQDNQISSNVQSNGGKVVEADLSSQPDKQSRPYNVFNAMVDTAKAAFGKEDVFTSNEVKNERQELCNTCTHKRMGRCTICGCVIELKIRYAQSECPIKKWLPEN